MTHPKTNDLLTNLVQTETLLRKYNFPGQAKVVAEIISSIQRGEPDYKRLSGLDMWGGAGAVWEVALTPGGIKAEEHERDERAFRQAIINIAAAMNKLGIGHARSRDIAATFRKWTKMF
jgi:hypothetical protein